MPASRLPTCGTDDAVTGLLLAHLVVGTVIVGFGRRLGRSAAWFALAAPIATLTWLAVHSSDLLDGQALSEQVAWIPGLGLNFDLRIDGFSALMILLVAGIGILVLTYAARYLPSSGPAVGRLVGLLVLFGGAMLGVVVADNLLVLYGFWELTSVTSFLLIGNDHRKLEARAAALQAFLVTGAGALAMLGGFLLLGQAAGTYQLSAILAAPPSGTVVGVALGLILLGAFTKSAQYPFHSWLPGAMVAPTPVSAYLHSATMVKAGVYLIARLSPAFAGDIAWWRPVVISVGLITMVAGGLRALRQHDLKLLLAHGTVSQLGFMVALFGIGTRAAMGAGAALLVAHALFKATAFMTVGIVDHQFGTRDLRCLPRLDRSWALPAGAAVVAAASMAGLPLTFGFVAKEAVLEAFLAPHGGAWAVASTVVVIGAALTVAYSIRFAWGILGGDQTAPVDVRPSEVAPHSLLVGPVLVLTAGTVVLGLLPGLADRLVGAAQSALEPASLPLHLAIWHGLNPALAASAVAVAVGSLVFWQRARVRPVLARGSAIPEAGQAYVATLRGLNALADRVTAVAQPGFLPIYAAVILFTAAALPLWALTTGPGWSGFPQLVDSPAHLPVAIVLLGSALAAVVVRRRFSAALFLGVVGYAMAALFVVQGAPDLALTQIAIETLTTVLFVLVLRRLPDRFTWAGPSSEGPVATNRAGDGTEVFERPSESVMTGRKRAGRLLVAAAVGGSVFVLALTMSAPQPDYAVSDEIAARSVPDGHGRNEVNVTLVDFRGYDTMGEITVLACAAIGTVALARAGRRPAHVPPPVTNGTGPEPDAEPWDRVAPAVPLGRLVNLDVSVRIISAVVLVGSVYLLFAGHNQPGGGFVGGSIAGAAVALRYVAGGIENVRALSRARPWTVLGVGLTVAIGTAAIPLLFGDAVLSSAYRVVDVPAIGSVSLASVLAFDIGVYLAVLGLVLMMFESFGDDPVVGTEPADITDIDVITEADVEVTA
ncbi:MAG: hydrogen gas-evolving membrane-bound hydrogenase subunit E [Aquihabitans sp.]